MNAACPTTGSAHSFFELRAYPLDMLPSCFRFLDGDGPAYPFVACERGEIFPRRQRSRVSGENFLQIRRHLMHRTVGDSFFGHKTILSNF